MITQVNMAICTLNKAINKNLPLAILSLCLPQALTEWVITKPLTLCGHHLERYMEDKHPSLHLAAVKAMCAHPTNPGGGNKVCVLCQPDIR